MGDGAAQRGRGTMLRSMLLGAAATALTVTAAGAQTAAQMADAHNLSANLLLPGCKALASIDQEVVPPEIAHLFLAGRCVGYIEAISALTVPQLGSGLCINAPASATRNQ